MPEIPPTRSSPPRGSIAAIAAIGAIVFVAAAAFAWVAGWLQPGRLTPQKMNDVIERSSGGPQPGFRRAHAKGICVSGRFASNGQGASLSKAGVFAAGATTPVLGRLSINGGLPHAADSTGRVRSMALLLKTADGQEWRTAMNSFPVFMVNTAAGFNDLNLASLPDPATGKPDPAKLAAFFQAHPESAPFFDWAKNAPWSTSFASITYNSVNSFGFVDTSGKRRYVRWSMQPQAAFEEMSAEQRAAATPDFLADELQARLARGPVSWDLVVTVAGDGDPVADDTKAWPEDRQKLAVGTLTLDHAEAQATGACRDLNFDPLILPAGIEGSDDPILAARSAVYSVSFNRRQQEIGRGEAPDATGAPASTHPQPAEGKP